MTSMYVFQRREARLDENVKVASHAPPYSTFFACSDARRSHRPTVEKTLATCSFHRDCNMVVKGRSTIRADAGKGPGVVADASTSRAERWCRLS